MASKTFGRVWVTRLLGHAIGVTGTIVAADWLAGTISPPLMDLFPLPPEDMHSLGAGFLGVAFIAWGTRLAGKARPLARGRVRRD